MRCLAARPLWLILLLVMTVPVFAGKAPVWIKSAARISEYWKEDQHLYIMGRTGVPDQGLIDLELWLDKNAPNWTVLLIQKSKAQSYKDATGTTFKGIDAVEHAMSKELRNRTGFARLTHPESHLPSGAFFIMFLDDRKFSYFGDKHYAQNGAGSEKWPDDLDEKARTAMRDGGRIVDAVRDTITNIDERVAGSLKRKNQMLEQTRKELEKEIGELSELLETVSKSRASVVSEFEEAKLLLQEFPIDDYDLKISGMKSALVNDDFEQAQLLGAIIRQKLEGHSTELASFEVDRAGLSNLRASLAGAKAETPAGEAKLTQARESFTFAQKAFAAGDPGYRNEMDASRVALKLIPIKDREAQELEGRRKRNYQIGGATGTGTLGLLCLFGNRGRRRSKKEAAKLLAMRKAEMKEIDERLFKLMDRSEIIVGDHEELTNRGYQGDTLTLSKTALSKIDQAFALSSHAQAIIERAETLIEPGNPISGVRNLVSSGRYNKAIDLLDSELSVGLKDVPTMNNRERPGKKVDETFQVPIDEWKDRTGQALDEAGAALDEVETAWSTIVARKEALRKRLDHLQTREEEIQVDEWLRCEQLFGPWEDAMNNSYEDAVSLSEADPVKALNGELKKGDRMTIEAHRVLEIITKIRTEKWDTMLEHEASLHERGRATSWIDRGLTKLSAQCDLIAEKSPNEEVGADIDRFKSTCADFVDRVSMGDDLAGRADDEAMAEIKAASEETLNARLLYSEKLNLTPDQLLRETEQNPDDHLGRAKIQHKSALSALDLGDVIAAEKFLDETDRLIQKSRDLITKSGEILEDFPDAQEELVAEYDSLLSGGRLMNATILELSRRFAPEALLSNPENPDSQSYRDLPARLEKDLDEILNATNVSKSRYHSGKLLESWQLIERGRALTKEGEKICIRTVAREQELETLESKNERNLRAQLLEEQDLQEPLKDRRVTVKTLAVFSGISVSLREAEQELTAPDGRRSPYRLQKLLAETGARLPVLSRAIPSDIDEHMQAVQLFETVERNQAEARQILQTATDDRIPNSPETNRAIEEVEKCHEWLREAKQELETDHADWREIQASLREIHLTISEAALALEQELRIANQVVNAIQASTHEVDRAAQWSGSHGVRITGSYGRRALAAANDDLQHGRYEAALGGTREARNRAKSAIASAETEEASRRREARLARQRRQSSRPSFGIASTRSSSGFGSSSISSFSSSRGSSGSSSSSNVGRSSFSSGSGVGRSGW